MKDKKYFRRKKYRAVALFFVGVILANMVGPGYLKGLCSLLALGSIALASWWSFQQTQVDIIENGPYIDRFLDKLDKKK